MLWEPAVSPFSVSARELGLFNTEPVAVMDNIARLAALALKADVGLVTTLDFSQDRQVFKGLHGLSGAVARSRTSPLTHSFCQQVVRSDRAFGVSDATAGGKVAENGPTSDMEVASYLGVPFHMPNGAPVGALCVIDRKPRNWTATDIMTLSDLEPAITSFIRLCAVNAGTMRLAEGHDRMADAMIRGHGSEADSLGRIMDDLKGVGISGDAGP